MRIGSLFSGAGGLDMAVQAVFGGEVVWHAEIDKAASKVLAYRFPGVPNLGSVTDIDWASVEPVDVLCGGYPCQPFSHAGQREGTNDDRHLWPHFAEAIRRIRPRYAVLENVAGHRSMGFDSVLADLASMRYDTQWCSVRASDVGAPHQRERLFVLAANSSRDGWDEGRPEPARLQRGFDAAVSGDGPVAEDCSQWTPTSAPASTASADCPPPSPSATTGRQYSAASSATDWLPSCTLEDLLPTPNAQDGNGGKAPRGGSNTHNTGTKRQVPLTDLPDLLPTPVSRDHEGQNQRGDTTCLTGALLPNPRSSDCFGAGQHGDGGMDLPTTVSQDGNGGESGLRRNSPGIEAVTYHFPTQGCCHPADARLVSDSDISCGVCLRHLTVEDAALSYETQWGKYAPAIHRWEQLTRPAPAPTEPNKNGNPRLSAAFSEWLMGWPDGWVTHPAIGISRNDQLRIIGNGVCPQQAAHALRFLLNVCEVAA